MVRVFINDNNDVFVFRCLDRPRSQTRVFDAGSGWGGTSFALERALSAEAFTAATAATTESIAAGIRSRVRVDGVSLSPVQVVAATQLARQRGVDGNVRFHLRSYDDPSGEGNEGGGSGGGGEASAVSSTKGEPYDLAVAAESLCHSRDIGKTLRAIGSVLRPSGPLLGFSSSTCRAAHVVIVEDVLAGHEPVTAPEAALDPLLRDYRVHCE